MKSRNVIGTEWQLVKLSITGAKVTASVNGKQVAELTLRQPATVKQIALTSPMSKSEYRSLRVTGKDGDVLLAVLPDSQ